MMAAFHDKPCVAAEIRAGIVNVRLRIFFKGFRHIAANSAYIRYPMTREDKVLVFFKLRGGSGPIDAIREAADVRVRWRSNPLAKKLVAAGLLSHPRNNHYVLTARGDARARELIGR